MTPLLGKGGLATRRDVVFGVEGTASEQTLKALTDRAAEILGADHPHAKALAEAAVSTYGLGTHLVDPPDACRQAYESVSASAEATRDEGRYLFLGRIAKRSDGCAMERFLLSEKDPVTTSEVTAIQALLPDPARLGGSAEWCRRAQEVLKRMRASGRDLW